MKKFLCSASVIAAAAVTAYYLTVTGIKGNASAFSTVGLEHRALFAIWGILTYIALAYNIHIAFSSAKRKLYYVIALALSFIGMAMTLIFDFVYDDRFQYIMHCAGSLMFSAVTGIAVFSALLFNKRYILAFICAAVLIGDLIMLLIFKETALIECVPIYVGYILLLINNLSKKENKIEIKR